MRLRSDQILLRMTRGVIKTRTLRRRVEEEQWDNEFASTTCSWDQQRPRSQVTTSTLETTLLHIKLNNLLTQGAPQQSESTNTGEPPRADKTNEPRQTVTLFSLHHFHSAGTAQVLASFQHSTDETSNDKNCGPVFPRLLGYSVLGVGSAGNDFRTQVGSHVDGMQATELVLGTPTFAWCDAAQTSSAGSIDNLPQRHTSFEDAADFRATDRVCCRRCALPTNSRVLDAGCPWQARRSGGDFTCWSRTGQLGHRSPRPLVRTPDRTHCANWQRSPSTYLRSPRASRRSGHPLGMGR